MVIEIKWWLIKYVVNEHGEVLKTINDDEDIATLQTGDRILRRNTRKYLENTVAINYGRFIKLNPDICESVFKYSRELFLLFKYVNFQTNILTWQNGRFIRPKQLAGILKKKRRTGNDIINNLIDEDIIHKHRDGKTFFYVINPYICIQGKEIPKWVYEEFKMTKYRKLIV